MALTATVHHIEAQVSDVDRGVYETLDFRLAQHPSETSRFLVTRMLAYCLSYEEGIAFSKGGLSDTDEPPLSVRDPVGTLLSWIDVGAPSADRMHKASKAARRVEIYTSVELSRLEKEAKSRPIHRLNEIVVWPLAPSLLDDITATFNRSLKLDLTRSDERLYVTIGASTFEADLRPASLSGEP